MELHLGHREHQVEALRDDRSGNLRCCPALWMHCSNCSHGRSMCSSVASRPKKIGRADLWQRVANGWPTNGDGALVQVRGDWEFHCQIFRLPKWSHGGNMCWMCKAETEGPLRFTACGTAAAWRATRRSHESYLLELAADGKEVPILLEQTMGLRLDCIMIDVLHTVDQGFASHIIGNMCWGVLAIMHGVQRIKRPMWSCPWQRCSNDIHTHPELTMLQ